MRGSRMDEGDLSASRTCARDSVNELETFPRETGEFSDDVFRREGEVMEPFAPMVQESGHAPLRVQRFDEFHVNRPRFQERHADPRRGDGVDVVQG